MKISECVCIIYMFFLHREITHTHTLIFLFSNLSDVSILFLNPTHLSSLESPFCLLRSHAACQTVSVSADLVSLVSKFYSK